MSDVDSIRNIVNKSTDPSVCLEQAKAYLQQFLGENDVLTLDVTLKAPVPKGPHSNEQVYTLQFSSERSTDLSLPYSDEGSITLQYTTGPNADWECSASMFGLTLKLDHPKILFANLLSGFKTSMQLRKDMVSRIDYMLSRYNGDEQQFSYRLGVDLGAVVVVKRLNINAPRSGVPTNFALCEVGGRESDSAQVTPPFTIWFSTQGTALPGRTQWKFGWAESPYSHKYVAGNIGIQQCQDDLDQGIAVGTKFLAPLADIDWTW